MDEERTGPSANDPSDNSEEIHTGIICDIHETELLEPWMPDMNQADMDEAGMPDTNQGDMTEPERRDRSAGGFLKRAGKNAAMVTLHIYDLSKGNVAIQGLNHVFQSVGTGVFHVGVEVYSVEWSYGYVPEPPDATGVFQNAPMECQLHTYRESVTMGTTTKQEKAIDDLVEEMKVQWLGSAYDLLRRNCTTFCDELCLALGVGHIPSWVRNLAGAGATITKGFSEAVHLISLPAVIAAAKAGEIDERYYISGAVTAPAKTVWNTVSHTVHVLDHKIQLSDRMHEVGEGLAHLAHAVIPLSHDPAVAPPSGGTVIQEESQLPRAAAVSPSQPQNRCCIVS